MLIKTFNINENNYDLRTISLSISDIPSGIYFIKINSNRNSQIKKIIINQ